MKVDRHSKIVELIGKYQIETQEELAEYLKKGRIPCDAGDGIERYPRIKAHKKHRGKTDASAT